MLDGKVVTRLRSVLPMLFEDIVEDDDDDDNLPEPVHIPTFLEATNFPAESMKIQIKRIVKFLKPLLKNWNVLFRIPHQLTYALQNYLRLRSSTASRICGFLQWRR